VIGILVSAIAPLLEKVIPDDDERAKMAHEIATLAERQAHEIALQQIEVNKLEAKSDSVFKGGWRPAIGWVCALAFAYHFVLQPLFAFWLSALGFDFDLPAFDMDSLMIVMGGLLGLGTMRTVERVKDKIPRGK